MDWLASPERDSMDKTHSQAGPIDCDESKGRVLVVDDEEVVLALLKALLEEDFEVDLADSGEQAISKLEQSSPDVVLVDKNLPGMSGLELLATIKKRWPVVEVIIITGYASLDSAIEGLRLGAFDYIQKPFAKPKLVIEKARRAVEKKRLIEENQQMQAVLGQSDRLASMGMLAAGVAHEINNPLAYIVYNLESLTEDLPKFSSALKKCTDIVAQRLGNDEWARLMGPDQIQLEPTKLNDIRDRISDALVGSLKIKEIARSLTTFSRVKSDCLAMVNLETVIDDAINMVRHELKARCRLVKEYGAVHPILANDGLLSQVFLNLLLNATHAIEEGDAQGNEIHVRTWQEGDEAVAEVRDTGKGIQKDHRGLLFDPFFTTREIGAGTGLGLYISKNIIESYGGRIYVTSEVGKGTSFVIHLPVQKMEKVGEAVSEKTAHPEMAEHGRILVIDDEVGIRKAIKRILAEHELVEANSGEEGQQILENDQEFDLILCDMKMPTMSGMELHEWLLKTNPDLSAKVIFITGSAFTPKVYEYLKNVSNICLNKPFDVALFKKTVADFVKGSKGTDNKG